MKQVLRTIMFLIFCGVMGLQSIHAQQYPVQANMTIAGPAPSTVSGFVPGNTSRINVNLLLNDVTTPSLDVRLRFIFEGPGFTIQTSPNAIVPDYTLQGGVPQNLGVTLEPYFQPNAFQLLNGSWGSFMPNGLLPEGNYTIKLQVLEPRRNVVISNTAITMAWVMLNDPPSIVQPADGAQLDPGAVQNVMFSWIPQNSVNPTGGHQIQYALELWEVPANADPNVTAGSMPSTYSYQLPMTTLIWNPSYPVLNPGSHYVCRVTASDPSNQVSFKNQGHSEPIMFQYGSACQTPLNPTHSEVDITQARISWVARPGSEQFRVEFIPTDADVGEEWRTIDTIGETALVQSLAPATSYNYRVRAVCGGFMSEPTMERTFTTSEMEPLNNECNLELETPEIDEEFLREDLEPLDMIWTGSFPMTIDEIESQNGTRFTGRGRLNMPLFNVSIRARFEDMEVTLLNKMASGTVSAMQGDSVTFNYGGGNGGGGGPGGGPGGGDIPTPDDTVNVNNPIDSLEQINDSTWIVYNGGDVDTAMVAAGGATYISDGAGTNVVVTEDDYFNVGEDGDGGPGGGADHDPVQDMIACERQIEFVPHSMSKYGMDAYRDPPVTGYQTLTMGTQVTGIGWKAMSTDETGMLRVEVNDSDTDELDFQYQSGGTGVSTDGDAASGYTLSLQTPDGNEDILLAVCDRDTTTGEASIAGGIGVAAYERLTLEVKVVPVGHELNYTEGQLEDALNDIYGQAVVSWNVEYLPALDINYWDENGDGLIERPNADYSNEMRAVWESFLASMQYDPVQPGEAYLFVIPGITEGGDVRGYMPIKSRYGFVTADATTRDVAHELGHGVFNLRHTFSEENSFTLPQRTTENLMDYSTGTELWKYQWDYIHNPEGGWHIFEDVEEGEMFDNYLTKNSIKNIINGIRSDNIQDEEYSDLTLYAFSEGSATNLQLNSDLSLDYISVEIKSGKNIGNIENPFIWQPLKIEPINIKQKTANTPPGEEGEFIKIYYNRIEEVSLPLLGYIESDTVGVSFILKENQRDDFLGYILNENLTDIILAQYSEAADTALSCAFSWSGNSMACNIGVRTAIYFYKNNQLLFPKSPGSGLFKSDQEPYLIGEITRPGKANDIYNDLENEELSEFEPISNATGCSYPDFDELQNQANNGVVIIGVRENSSGSGHIVLIMPKSFNQGDEPTSFPIGVKTVKYPICLECGFGEKMTEPFRDKSNISEYVWYKY